MLLPFSTPRALLATSAALATALLPLLAQAADDAALTAGSLHLEYYGIVDVGVSTQTHGTPFSDYYAQGLEYGVSSNSNRSVTALAPNGLSQSRLGLRGTLAADDALAAIFQVETRFSPLSGEIANGPKSLIQNNGVAPGQQVSASDSSQAGQLLSGAAWAGLRSSSLGTLTVGRQNGFLYDNILAYDPQGGGYAFSLIGFSAVAAGGGDSEYNRLNGSARYQYERGPLRLGVQYQPAGQEVGGAGRQLSAGLKEGAFAADLAYAEKRDAISLGSYSPTPAQLTALNAAGLALGSSLKATISDNRTWQLALRHQDGAWQQFVGYERIGFANPSQLNSFVRVGSSTVGGYFVGSVNASAYPQDRVLQVAWAGAKYQWTNRIRFTGAAYGYRQNNYGTGTNAGCSSPVAASCSGGEVAVSGVAEFQYDRHFDFYAGILRTAVSGGLSSGYLENSNLSTTAGVLIGF